MSDELVRATTSLSSTCKRSIDATIWRSGGRIAQWYDAMMEEQPILTAPDNPKPAKQGCPFDCGPCTSHEQQVLLPIVPITSACNLDCPI